MTVETKEYFSTTDVCHQEILNARDIFTNKNVTETRWHEVENMLAIMFLHCPEEVSGMVFATLEEMTRRKDFMHTFWKKE